MDRLKKLFCKKETHKETERKIRANDTAYNATFNYSNNRISTSKYNLITFLPKNLFEQFQRLANAYFLFLLILQLIPVISSLPPITTILPLVCVLAVSALKDAVDDIQRHRSDSQVNNRRSWVLRAGELVEAKWQTVVVGDIIKMENDQFVAADLLLLSSSEPNGLCYVETAELDGETNLKVRQALKETASMGDTVELLAEFDGEVICEPPNDVLNKFEGTLTLRRRDVTSSEGQTLSLDNDKVLLRGCVLRNTDWCFGLVLFAGRDTKLMMNSGKTTFKRTHIDVLMNVLIIGIFVFLLGMCLACAIGCGVWETFMGYKFTVFLPWEPHVPTYNNSAGAAVIACLQFFSYIIVLNTVVPISLYVSVEMIRFGHSLWIDWDRQMYYAKTNTPAKSRTTTLNEELGQIEYIFSDKTGTLTQNIMTFNKCSIGGVTYGDVIDEYGRPADVTERTPKVDFSSNPYHEPKFEFYDQRLLDAVKHNNADVHAFFRLLAICHTVMAADKDGVLEYQAQSPDEAALVAAARNFGFVFKSRTPDTVTIEVLGVEEVYELLGILDFDNVRKRMSVLVRQNNVINLYCKGADSTIFERLDNSCTALQAATTAHLENFAQDGLRTLCCAVKPIDESYFDSWKARHHAASISLQNRDEKLSAVYEEIEEGLLLLGATAIEDKLQDGVPEAIANLSQAGIKIWVLTGDKQETAVNIGYSCQLLTDEMAEIHVIDADSFQDVERQLTDARKRMEPGLGGSCPALSPDTPNGMRCQDPGFPISPGVYSNGCTSPGAVNSAGRKVDPTSFAIIVNGHSLEYGLDPKLESLLLETTCQCRAVICCRVTPLQKARVVDLVKRHRKTITLAIGDGANDVSMIKTAHIGVGISGQEGMQAVLASDYSLAQFCFLERLLLVHGRWSYIRMCKFLRYFFYKNFAFTLCHLWFAFFCGFSAQTLYDQSFITLYNIVYTSLPVLALGFLDQDVSDVYSLRYPKLYTPGHLDLFFNKKVFTQSAAEGIVSSVVLFFIPFGTFCGAIQADGRDVSGLQAFGTVVSSTLIIVVSLRCGLETSYWTVFNHVCIWGSVLCYFALTLLAYSSGTSIHYLYEGVAVNVMSTANFWFTLLLCSVVLLLPVVAERFYYIDTRPTLADKVRLKQKVSKLKMRAGDRILRRASTVRRSRRTVSRSGYAFAHQQGFGELITSGSMLSRQQAPPTAAAYAAAMATRGVDVATALRTPDPATADSAGPLRSATVEDLTLVSRL